MPLPTMPGDSPAPPTRRGFAARLLAAIAPATAARADMPLSSDL
jgi:hypothetical protein